MTDRESLWSRIAPLIAEASDSPITANDVRPEALLRGELNISSLMVVHLVLNLEKEFGITVIESDFENLVKAGDIEDIIARKVTPQPTATL